MPNADLNFEGCYDRRDIVGFFTHLIRKYIVRYSTFVLDVQLIAMEHPARPVAILFDVEPSICLYELRSAISNQVAEVISSNDYRFQHHRVELFRSQENLVTL